MVPENAEAVMRTTLLQSKFTECKERQSLNASASIKTMLFGNAISSRLVPSNEPVPKFVTVDGITMAPKFDDLKA